MILCSIDSEFKRGRAMLQLEWASSTRVIPWCYRKRETTLHQKLRKDNIIDVLFVTQTCNDFDYCFTTHMRYIRFQIMSVVGSKR